MDTYYEKQKVIEIVDKRQWIKVDRVWVDSDTIGDLPSQQDYVKDIVNIEALGKKLTQLCPIIKKFHKCAKFFIQNIFKIWKTFRHMTSHIIISNQRHNFPALDNFLIGSSTLILTNIVPVGGAFETIGCIWGQVILNIMILL